MKKIIFVAALFFCSLSTSQAQTALNFSTSEVMAIKPNEKTEVRYSNVSKITVELTVYNIEEKYRPFVIKQLTNNLLVDGVLTLPTEEKAALIVVKNGEKIAINYSVKTVVFIPQSFANN